MKSSLITAATPPADDLLSPSPRRRHRILYVASTRHAGGLELASIRLADLLMRTQPERQEIIFACRPGKYIEEQCIRSGIQTVPLTVRNSGDLSGVKSLAQTVIDHEIDIMHVHSRRDYVTSTLAKIHLQRTAPISTPKLLLHMHLMRSLGSPAFLSGYFFAPNVDRYLAVSGAVRNHLLAKHKQLSRDQVVVVPNSVDFDRFSPSREMRQAIRRRYDIPDTALVIGMVGRLDTKGQNEAIKAVGNLNRDDVYLMLVGAPGKASYLKALKKIAQRMNLSSRVIFCGTQEDVPAYFSAMDMLAHLPRDEAFGLAPAEAMATQLPVLVSNVGGCVELVTDNQTGMIVAPRKQVEITRRLQEMIASPVLRERLGAAGCDFVRSHFSTQAQASILTQVYDDVMSMSLKSS